MFSKSTSNSNIEFGSPKPSLIKKKARNTILNVLNKRQTQEKSIVPEKRNPSLQQRSAWRSEPTAHQPEQGPRRTSRDSIGHVPKTVLTGPVNRASHSSGTSPSPVQQSTVRYPTQTRSPDHVAKHTDRPVRVEEQPVFKTSASSFQSEEPPKSPSKFSNLLQKWSSETSPKERGVTRKASDASSLTYTPEHSRRASDCSPKSPIRVQKMVSIKSPSSPPVTPGRDSAKRGYSVVVQSSTKYPPPLRRKSSADVTPYSVTVNTIRVYEATPKMVEADPDPLSRLDRYPIREPPVMSPTSMEQITREKERKTGIEKKNRALVMTNTRPLNTTDASPKLVSDSVQVSIPFGVPATPTSPRSGVGSDVWSSSVSVCVPFQVTENGVVKPLPVRGGGTPQSLASSESGLTMDAIEHLFDGESSPGLPIESSRSPKLVTVRRRPAEETVQKIIHFDDALLQGQPRSEGLDMEDGMANSKRGKYSFGNFPDKPNAEVQKKSSSLRREAERREAERQTDSLVDRPSTSKKTSTLPIASNSLKKDEIEMLKARIRQLEAELEQERTKQTPNEDILSSIPILEKEKLRLQAQLNESSQELTKTKSQLRIATYSANRKEAEKDVLETKYQKLQKDFEKVQSQNEKLEYERDQLLREKKNRTNENDKDMDAQIVTIETLSRRNDELLRSESELRERMSSLVKGLGDVRESVGQVRQENLRLHDDIVDNGVAMADTMKQCTLGLHQVVDQINYEAENKRQGLSSSVSSDEIARLTEELQDSKTCVHALLQRVVELETTGGDSERPGDSEVNYDGCPGCARLREQLSELRSDYDAQKEMLAKVEAEMEEFTSEREDIQEEVKYLKKVLSYREDVMQVQVSQKTTRQMERLETNLEEAENKCKDLEDEVGRLYNQKQSLLTNILKLHEEEVAAQDGEDDDEDDDDDDDDDEIEVDEDDMSDDQSGRLSFPRSKGNKRALYGSNDAEFSSGASFYESDSESDSESDQWSELDDSSQRLQDYVKGIVSERKRQRSNIKELMRDKRNLNKRVDKSTDDFKSLMKRIQKLDSENVSLREKVKNERRSLKAKLKDEERANEKLRADLKETESEKEALMKCIEMNSSASEVEATEPTDELDMDDFSRLIAKAQAFALEDKQSRKSGTSDEETEHEEEVESDASEDQVEGKKEVESEAESTTSSEGSNQQVVSVQVTEPLYDNVRKSDSDEIQQRIKKEEKADSEEELQRRREEEEGKDEMEEMLHSPPPPHARMLQRRASTVGINMDRVNREKQHLEEEVASLRKYLNKSTTRRRFSTVESPKTPPLGAMKTLESLLQKSDMELKEANAKISRLQSMNADMEERMKDLEAIQDDLRSAVVIANNYASEEREKYNALEEEKDALVQKLETLKRENSRLRKSRAINAAYRKGTRSVKSLTTSEEDMVDSDGADVESDFSSMSRKSSNASDM